MSRAALLLAAVLFIEPRPAPHPKTIIVTAYCPCELCCDYWAHLPDRQRTFADGSRFDRHAKVCAVDTKVFPFGTVFDIPGLGRYVARDRGGKVKGNHIDILMPTHKQALAFGRRTFKLERTK